MSDDAVEDAHAVLVAGTFHSRGAFVNTFVSVQRKSGHYVRVVCVDTRRGVKRVSEEIPYTEDVAALQQLIDQLEEQHLGSSGPGCWV